MATLYITEYAIQGRDQVGKQMVVALEPPIAEQTVSIGATSAASNALNDATAFVRLATDAICSVAFGTAPTAAATGMRMAANTAEYFAVPPGKAFKVAVITNT
jgi:hypothetical protein